MHDRLNEKALLETSQVAAPAEELNEPDLLLCQLLRLESASAAC